MRDRLTLAAYENGLADEDGDESVAATIASGLNGGKKHPRAVPDSPDDCWNKVDDKDDGPGLTLPPRFWERPSLANIRQAAWSKMMPPDVVLNVIMAEVSASIPPNVRVDTGILDPLPIHHYAGLVGPAGGTKSTAMGIVCPSSSRSRPSRR